MTKFTLMYDSVIHNDIVKTDNVLCRIMNIDILAYISMS